MSPALCWIYNYRFANEISQPQVRMVTNKKTREVAVQFNKTPRTLSNFSFQCIHQVQASSESESLDTLLVTKEAYWSAQLFSLAPFGLNNRQEFHPKNKINYN